ncbi:MAG: ScpA family protein [Candidatus Magasanikbacteria bacterium]|jgi:segregation and condensation protein A
MISAVKLEKFEGPLDLLLQLVELEKMNISEIALSEVTDQFLLYLNKLEGNRSEELADFLVIATKLVYLKSRTLLPYLYPEEDDGPSLADQLKLYKQYIEASKKILILWEQNRIAYGRIEPPVKPDGFVLPGNAQTTDLHRSMLALVARLRPISALPTATIDHTISVKHKIESIYNLVKSRRHLNFKDLLASAYNRTEVIISFLALLELVKDSKASVHQKDAYSDMEVRAV